MVSSQALASLPRASGDHGIRLTPWSRQSGPDGWPEAAADWITPQTLAARIDWALRVPARFVDPLPDPRALIDTALGGSASEALATAVPRAETVREGVALVLASTDFNRR